MRHISVSLHELHLQFPNSKSVRYDQIPELGHPRHEACRGEFDGPRNAACNCSVVGSWRSYEHTNGNPMIEIRPDDIIWEPYECNNI